MMRMASGGRVALLLFLAIACPARQSSTDVAAVRRSLDSTLVIHAQHFALDDPDSLASAYAEDAVVRPAHMEPLSGRAAIRTGLEGWLKAAPVKSVAYRTEDLAVYGDSAFHIVSYDAVVQPSGGADLADHGTCVLFWVRQTSAGWKIHRSTCNSSVPLPAPGR